MMLRCLSFRGGFRFHGESSSTSGGRGGAVGAAVLESVTSTETRSAGATRAGAAACRNIRVPLLGVLAAVVHASATSTATASAGAMLAGTAVCQRRATSSAVCPLEVEFHGSSPKSRPLNLPTRPSSSPRSRRAWRSEKQPPPPPPPRTGVARLPSASLQPEASHQSTREAGFRDDRVSSSCSLMHTITCYAKKMPFLYQHA